MNIAPGRRLGPDRVTLISWPAAAGRDLPSTLIKAALPAFSTGRGSRDGGGSGLRYSETACCGQPAPTSQPKQLTVPRRERRIDEPPQAEELGSFRFNKTESQGVGWSRPLTGVGRGGLYAVNSKYEDPRGRGRKTDRGLCVARPGERRIRGGRGRRRRHGERNGACHRV